MKARYLVTNHPGVVVVLRVELDNGETASTTHGFQTVFEANEYCPAQFSGSRHPSRLPHSTACWRSARQHAERGCANYHSRSDAPGYGKGALDHVEQCAASNHLGQTTIENK